MPKMHEVSIMENILAIVEPPARAAGAASITRITLVVGELSGVAPEALEFAFQALSPGTLAEHAELVIRRIPVRCFCRTCRKEFQPAGPFYECPSCGGLTTEITAGRELQIASVEIP
ncbi:MAG: hydrogenase maturation nickel metallochaperone HypA [Chthonomonadales bacterium]